MDKWICPTDRQLALRAKLGTGWSFFTNRSNNDQDRIMTVEEHRQIVEIMKKKELCDKIEKERIGHMMLHLQNIKNNQSPKRPRDCHICGDCVSLFTMAVGNKVCSVCTQNTCDQCLSSVTSCSSSPSHGGSITSPDPDKCQPRQLSPRFNFHITGSRINVKICKYCFEIREIWKRSGAWQQDQLPDFKLPKVNTICLHPETCSKVIVNNKSANIDSASWETYQKLPKWIATEENVFKETSSDEPCAIEPAFEKFSFNPFDEEMKEDSTDHCALEGISSNQSQYTSHKWNTDDPPVGSLFWSRDSINKSKKRPKEEFLGTLNYKVFHDSSKSQLIISIISANDLKSMDSNGLSDPYVKCNMLPGNTHKTKLRTKTCYKTLNPVWNENLVYHGINRDDMDNKTLRLAVLDEDKFGFDWIGEYRLFLPDLISDEEYSFNHRLIARQPIAKGFDDLIDHERGKILLSLLYDNKNSTLRVAIIRCAELAPMDCNGFSDPFCKIYLKPDKLRKTKRKTQTKKMTLNPYFNEEFIIELESNWCKEKILEISVWDYDRGPKNDFIGCVKFHNRAKGDRGRLWRTISEKPNKNFEGWFILCADMSDID